MTNTTIRKPTNFRKDISSNQLKPKSELIRVVKTPSGEIQIDWHQNIKGRGVYLQKDLQAVKLVWKKNGLTRGLKTKVADQIYDELLRFLANGN